MSKSTMAIVGLAAIQFRLSRQSNRHKRVVIARIARIRDMGTYRRTLWVATTVLVSILFPS